MASSTTLIRRSTGRSGSRSPTTRHSFPGGTMSSRAPMSHSTLAKRCTSRPRAQSRIRKRWHATSTSIATTHVSRAMCTSRRSQCVMSETVRWARLFDATTHIPRSCLSSLTWEVLRRARRTASRCAARAATPWSSSIATLILRRRVSRSTGSRVRDSIPPNSQMAATFSRVCAPMSRSCARAFTLRGSRAVTGSS